MQITVDTPITHQIAPARIGGWLLLCESNYRLLEQLFANTGLPFEQVESTSNDGHTLRCTVLERAPYCLTVRLTGGWEAHPPAQDWKLRLYHDAKQLEVLTLPHAQIDRDGWLATRWERNWALGEWLRYCLTQGHGFFHKASSCAAV